MLKYFCSNGFGITHSSISKLSQAFLTQGSNNEGLFVNLATGNFYSQTIDIELFSNGLNIPLQRIYNSHSKKPWQISATPKIIYNSDARKNEPYIEYHCPDGFVLKAKRIVKAVVDEKKFVMLKRDNLDDSFQLVTQSEIEDDFETIDVESSDEELVSGNDTENRASQNDQYEIISYELGKLSFERNEKGGWVCYIHKTGETQVFSRDGYLESRHSLQNAHLLYQWKKNTHHTQQLEKIIDKNTGIEISFSYNNGVESKEIIASYKRINNPPVEILCYTFDKNNRLINVLKRIKLDSEQAIHHPDIETYQIKYQYYHNTHYIKSILQTDGNEIYLNYESIVGKQHLRVKSISDMENSARPWRINSLDEGEIIIVTSPKGNQFRYEIDLLKGDIISYQVNDISNNFLEQQLIDRYEYDENSGVLKVIIHADGSHQLFQYDTKNYLITDSYCYENLQEIALLRHVHYEYNQAGLVKYLAITEKNEVIKTYAVFSKNIPQQLRFEINAVGQVTEYRYNKKGQREEIFNYFEENMPILKLSEKLIESDMENWVLEYGNNKKLIQKTRFTYDHFGQIMVTYRSLPGDYENKEAVSYQEIDEFGNSIISSSFGELIQKLPKKIIKYDLLNRPASITNFNNHKIKNSFINESKKYNETVLPNGLIKRTRTDIFDEFTQESILCGGQDKHVDSTRIVKNLYDKENRPFIKYNELGQIELSLYDVFGREIASINSEGYLTYFYRDVFGNILCEAKFSEAAPDLLKKNNINCTDLMEIISNWKNKEPYSEKHYFYDGLNRKRFAVDQEGCVTQYQYNIHDKVFEQTAYEQRIFLQSLPRDKRYKNCQERIASLIPILETNRIKNITRYFYDKSGELVATLYPSGLLVETISEYNGLFQKIIHYKNRAFILNKGVDLNKYRPECDNSVTGDSVAYILHDTLKRKIAEIDAEGYLLEYRYDIAGNNAQTIRYYNKVNFPEKLIFTLEDILKDHVLHVEDWVTTFEYDASGRVIKTIHPNGKVENIEYDVMGEISAHFMTDTVSTQRRGTIYKRNIYGEKIAELSSLGVDLLQHNEKESESIWIKHATHFLRNSVGNIIAVKKSSDSGEKYYLNKKGGIRFSIAASGLITEYEYDFLGEQKGKKQLSHPIPQEDLELYSGGEINPEIETKLKLYSNSEKDRVERTCRDRCGRITYIEKANGQFFWKSYNGLGEEEFSAHNFNDDRVLINEHYYSAMSSLIDIKQYAVRNIGQYNKAWLDTFIKSLGDYNEPKNHIPEKKRALFYHKYDLWNRIAWKRDAEHVYRHTTYDKRNLPVEIKIGVVDEIIPITVIEYDSHGRIVKEINTEGAIKKYEYQTVSRKVKEFIENEFDFPAVEYTYNAFGEIIEERQGQVITTISRNAEGKPICSNNNVAGEIIHQYDEHGRIKEIQAANSAVMLEYEFNKEIRYTTTAYAKYTEIVQNNQFNEVTQTEVTFERNNAISSFDETIDNSARYQEKIERDIKNNIIMLFQDPTGINRCRIDRYQVNGNKRQQQIVSSGNEIIATTDFKTDEWGRVVGEVSDPENLKITQITEYDDTQEIIGNILIMPEGNRHNYILRCATKLVTLSINANYYGTLTEINSSGHIIKEIQLAKQFSIKTIEFIRKNKEKSRLINNLKILNIFDPINDIVTQNIYNFAGLLRFAIDPEGAMVEHTYDVTGNKKSICHYAQTLDKDKVGDYILSELVNISQKIKNPKQDSKVIFINDKKGDARYTIKYANEKECYLVEKQFDQSGNEIAHIAYAKAILLDKENPQEWTLEFVELLAKRLADYSVDRISRYFYVNVTNKAEDSLLLFQLITGVITQYEYNLHGKVVRELRYGKTLSAQEIKYFNENWSINTLTQACTKLRKNAACQINIKEIEYDGLGRKIISHDAEGGAEHITWNLLDKEESIRDKNGEVCEYELDKVGRPIKEILPSRPVTTIVQNPDHHLTAEVAIKSLEIINKFNSANEAVYKIEGEGDTIKEQVFQRDGRGNILRQSTKNIPRYNQYYNVEVTDFHTKNIYDSFNRKVKVVYPDKTTQYTIYDKNHRPRFLIDQNKYIIEHVYQAPHKKPIKNIFYKNTLVFNDSAYPDGMTILTMPKIIRDSENDREISYEYDLLERMVSQSANEDIFFSAEFADPEKQFFKLTPRNEIIYNAFDEEIYAEKIENPYANEEALIRPSGIFAGTSSFSRKREKEIDSRNVVFDACLKEKRYKYYNFSGQVIAEIDEGGYLTTIQNDFEGMPIRKIEHAKPLIAGSYDIGKLPINIDADPVNDREWLYQNDSNGRQIAEIILDHAYEEIADLLSDRADKLAVQTKKAKVIKYKIRDGVGREAINVTAMILPHGDLELIDTKITLATAEGLPWLIIDSPKTTYHGERTVAVKINYFDANGNAVGYRHYAKSLSLKIYEKWSQQLKNFLQQEKYERKAMLELIKDATALSDGIEESAQDLIALNTVDSLGRILISQTPTHYRINNFWYYNGLAKQISHDIQPKFVREKERAEKVISEGFEEVRLVKTFFRDAKGQEIKCIEELFEFDNVEPRQYNVSTTRRNAFNQIEARGDGERELAFIVYSRNGHIRCTNTEKGIWKRIFTTPSGYESLIITSAQHDVSQKQFDGEVGLRRLLSLPAEQLILTQQKFDSRGNRIETKEPFYTKINHAPEITLSQICDKDGRYALVWRWGGNRGTEIIFKIRIQGIVQAQGLHSSWDEWEVLPVVSFPVAAGETPLYGVYLSSKNDNTLKHKPSDLYDIEVSFYHHNAQGQRDEKPFSAGICQMVIITPNNQESRHAVFYPSGPTSIAVAGKIEEQQSSTVMGLQLIQDDQVVKAVAISTTNDGRKVAEVSDMPRGNYYTRLASLTEKIGTPFLLNSQVTSFTNPSGTFFEEDLEVSTEIMLPVRFDRIDYHYAEEESHSPEKIPLYKVSHYATVILTAKSKNYRAKPIECEILLRTQENNIISLKSKIIDGYAEAEYLLVEFYSENPTHEWNDNKPVEARIDQPICVERIFIKGKLSGKNDSSFAATSLYTLHDQQPPIGNLVWQDKSNIHSFNDFYEQKSMPIYTKQRTLFIHKSVISSKLKKSPIEQTALALHITTSQNSISLPIISQTGNDFALIDINTLGNETLQQVQLLGAAFIPHPHYSAVQKIEHNKQEYSLDLHKSLIAPLDVVMKNNPIIDSYFATLHVDFVEQAYKFRGYFYSNYIIRASNLGTLPKQWFLGEESNAHYFAEIYAGGIRITQTQIFLATKPPVENDKTLEWNINFIPNKEHVYSPYSLRIYRETEEGVQYELYSSVKNIIRNKYLFCDSYTRISSVDEQQNIATTWPDRPSRTIYYLRGEKLLRNEGRLELTYQPTGAILPIVMQPPVRSKNKHYYVDLSPFMPIDITQLSAQFYGVPPKNNQPVQPTQIEIRSQFKQEMYAGEAYVTVKANLLPMIWRRIKDSGIFSESKYAWVGRNAVLISCECSPDLGNGPCFITLEYCLENYHSQNSITNDNGKQKLDYVFDIAVSSQGHLTDIGLSGNPTGDKNAMVTLKSLTQIIIKKEIDGVMVTLYEGPFDFDNRITRRFIYLAPLPKETAQTHFICQPTEGLVQRLEIVPQQIFPNNKAQAPFALFSAEGMRAGHYRYQIQACDKQNMPLSLVKVAPKYVSADKITAQGELVIRHQGIAVPRAKQNEDEMITPIHQWKYNRWNEIEYENPNHAVTTRKFNRYNLLIEEILPEVELMLPERTTPIIPPNIEYTKRTPESLIKVERPVVHYFYDKRLHQLGVRKANGTILLSLKDEGGNEVARFTPNGLELQRIFNVLNQFTGMIDVFGKRTSVEVTKEGKPKQVIYPNGIIEKRKFNLRGDEIIFIDGNGSAQFQQIGLNGVVRATLNADGELIVREFYHNRELRKETLPDASSNEFWRDWNGYIYKYRDRGNAMHYLEYDYAKQLKRQHSDRGRDIRYAQHHNSKPFQIYDVKNQQLEEIEQSPTGQQTRQRLFVPNLSGGVISDQYTRYDTHDSKKEIRNNSFTVKYHYDSEKNIRAIDVTDLYHPDTGEKLPDQTQVFTFNENNQVEINHASRNASGMLEVMNETAQAKYEKGRRTELSYLRYFKDEENHHWPEWVTEKYTHNEDGQLRRIDVIGAKFYNGTAIEILSDNVNRHIQVNEIRRDRNNELITIIRQFVYTTGGKLQKINEYQNNKLRNKIDQSHPGDYGPDGILKHSQHSSYDKKGGWQFTDHFFYDHEKFAQPQISSIIRTHEVKGHAIESGNTNIIYDSNETAKTITDSNSRHADKHFTSDESGKIYERREGARNEKLLRAYYDQRGWLVAIYERDGQHPEKALGKWLFDNGTQAGLERYSHFQPMTLTPTNPEMTLIDIVMDFFSGDWGALIALQRANGFISATEPLMPGQPIRIPYRDWQNKFNADTKREMHIGTVLGAITPVTPLPHIEESKEQWVQAIPIAITVCITAAISTLITPAAFSALGPMLSVMTSNATAFAAGDAAAQLAANIIGTRNGFDWKEFGGAAIIGAASAGMGFVRGSSNITLNNAAFNTTMHEALHAMQETAVTHISRYLLGGIIGNGPGFSWRSLVSDMLTAGIGELALGKMSDAAQRELQEGIGRLAGETAQALAAGLLDMGLMKMIMDRDQTLLDMMTKVGSKIVVGQVKKQTAEVKSRLTVHWNSIRDRLHPLQYNHHEEALLLDSANEDLLRDPQQEFLANDEITVQQQFEQREKIRSYNEAKKLNEGIITRRVKQTEDNYVSEKEYGNDMQNDALMAIASITQA